MVLEAVFPNLITSLSNLSFSVVKFIVIFILLVTVTGTIIGLVIDKMYKPDFVPSRNVREKERIMNILNEFKNNKNILSNREIVLSYRNVPSQPYFSTANPESVTKVLYDKRDPTGETVINLYPDFNHYNYTFVDENGIGRTGVDMAAFSNENHDYGTTEGLNQDRFRITAPRPNVLILSELARRNTRVTSGGFALANFTIVHDRPSMVGNRAPVLYPNSTYIYANRADAIGHFDASVLPPVSGQ